MAFMGMALSSMGRTSLICGSEARAHVTVPAQLVLVPLGAVLG